MEAQLHGVLRNPLGIYQKKVDANDILLHRKCGVENSGLLTIRNFATRSLCCQHGRRGGRGTGILRTDQIANAKQLRQSGNVARTSVYSEVGGESTTQGVVLGQLVDDDVAKSDQLHGSKLQSGHPCVGWSCAGHESQDALVRGRHFQQFLPSQSLRFLQHCRNEERKVNKTVGDPRHSQT